MLQLVEQYGVEYVGHHVRDANTGVRVQVIHDGRGTMRGLARGDPWLEFETLPAGTCGRSVAIVYYA